MGEFFKLIKNFFTEFTLGEYCGRHTMCKPLCANIWDPIWRTAYFHTLEKHEPIISNFRKSSQDILSWWDRERNLGRLPEGGRAFCAELIMKAKVGRFETSRWEKLFSSGRSPRMSSCERWWEIEWGPQKIRDHRRLLFLITSALCCAGGSFQGPGQCPSHCALQSLPAPRTHTWQKRLLGPGSVYQDPQDLASIERKCGCVNYSN